MITKEKAVSIGHTVINSDESNKIFDMFFKVLAMENLSLINREFKEGMEVDEEVTMRVVVVLDKRKIQG